MRKFQIVDPSRSPSTTRQLDIATDGDVITHTPAEFECLPAAVRLLVPRNPSEGVALASKLAATV